MSYTEELGKRAKAAEAVISTAGSRIKDEALAAISRALIENQELIIAENAKNHFLVFIKKVNVLIRNKATFGRSVCIPIINKRCKREIINTIIC